MTWRFVKHTKPQFFGLLQPPRRIRVDTGCRSLKRHQPPGAESRFCGLVVRTWFLDISVRRWSFAQNHTCFYMRTTRTWTWTTPQSSFSEARSPREDHRERGTRAQTRTSCVRSDLCIKRSSRRPSRRYAACPRTFSNRNARGPCLNEHVEQRFPVPVQVA